MPQELKTLLKDLVLQSGDSNKPARCVPILLLPTLLTIVASQLSLDDSQKAGWVFHESPPPLIWQQSTTWYGHISRIINVNGVSSAVVKLIQAVQPNWMSGDFPNGINISNRFRLSGRNASSKV
jgi:hypothetical protein